MGGASEEARKEVRNRARVSGEKERTEEIKEGNEKRKEGRK